MRDLLQLSDLHIGRSAAVTTQAIGAIDTVLARWSNDPERPLIVVTGDLTQDGTVEQYAVAGREIGRLRAAGFEVHCVPGNHDYGWSGNWASASRLTRFHESFCGGSAVTYPHTVTSSGWAVVGLNSMLDEAGVLDGLLANGELGDAQLAALDETLSQLQAPRASGALRIAVALHHHPFLLPPMGWFERLREWGTHWLKDGEALMPLLADRIDVLLFGHDHEHLDLSQDRGGGPLTTRYRIPKILACGSSAGLTRMSGAGNLRRAWLIPRDGGAALPLIL